MNDYEYRPRDYRNRIEDKDLVSFIVTVKETDLFIRARENLQKKAHRMVLKYRYQLEKYIETHPGFQKSLAPLPDTGNNPRIVKMMMEAGQKTGVGPMAAVAGAIAECVGQELLEFSQEVIVENGGDIFMKTKRKRVVGIYAGESPLSGKVGVEIDKGVSPTGICTSSGTVGHSLSFGKTDAVVVIAGSTTMADAAATAIGNMVKSPDDVTEALEFGGDIEGLRGIIIIMDDTIGVRGELKLCEITP